MRSCGPLAQLDRASGYGPEGQGFESLRVRQKHPLSPLWGRRVFSMRPRGDMRTPFATEGSEGGRRSRGGHGPSPSLRVRPLPAGIFLCAPEGICGLHREPASDRVRRSRDGHGPSPCLRVRPLAAGIFLCVPAGIYGPLSRSKGWRHSRATAMGRRHALGSAGCLPALMISQV